MPRSPDDVYAGSALPYRALRRADDRIGGRIRAAVGEGSVVNVGAGTGSYEDGLPVVAAVDPSAAMLGRRTAAAPAVRGRAEGLPLRDGCADVALAVLTIHHWTDLEGGVREMLRVARRRVVFLTWDPSFARQFWLADYLPSTLVTWDAARFPAIERLLALLPDAHAHVEPLDIPHDCTDGFLGAYWRRPTAYLSPEVRLGISSLTAWEASLAGAWAQLEDDVTSGRWRARHGRLLELEALDLGYRLIHATF